MEFKSNRSARFPCGMCKSKCVSDCVKCYSCKLWYHGKCQDFEENELAMWADINMDYVCVSCRTLDGDEFDYFMGMQRLRKASVSRNIMILKEAVQRELLFKVKLNLPPPNLNLDDRYPEVDRLAADLMGAYVDGVIGNPRVTAGNGDCLFNAVSILLCGDESMSVPLRYHTCLNLVSNRNQYMEHPLRRQLQVLSCSYETACLSAAKIGAASSAWTILALADVVCRPLRIIYPPVNGHTDVAYSSLNTVFTHVPDTIPTLNVLWHNLRCMPTPGEWYTVNHFSAVTDVQEIQTSTTPKEDRPIGQRVATKKQQKRVKGTPVKEDTSSTCTSPNLSPVKMKSPSWSQPKRRKTSNSSFLVEESTESDLSMLNRFECLSDSEIDNPSILSGDVEIERPNCSDSFRDASFCKNESVVESAPDTSTGEQVVNDEITCDKRPDVHLKPLKSGRFLSNTEIFDVLIKTENRAENIPSGEKNNVYVVMDSKENDNGRAEFPDDCGVWDSKAGTTVNQYFVAAENTFKNVFKKDDIYCQRKIVNKELTYLPMQPQPTNVFTLHRYYAELKGEDYKKRVSYIKKTPDNSKHLLGRCVVEYVGTRKTTNRPHGNSKTGEAYKRTDPAVIRHAAQKVGTKTATEVVADMASEESILAPKSARQVQDRMYYERKKIPKPVSGTNIADTILAVISQINVNDFVQEIIITKDKDPVVILYTEEQILDLKRNCQGEYGSVIGVDRTFNLGRLFVTAMCYKNRSLLSRKTNQYPIFLGPLCLQWDGEQSSYQKFFNHIREKLDSDDFTFGTDDEKAMTNSLRNSFRDSSFLLCTKHLKDNVRHYLQKHGTDQKSRESIVDIIFDEDGGLVFCEDEFDFAQREDDLSIYFQKYPIFKSYYDRFLAQKLKNFVFRPLKDKKISKLWTNNNSESINNRLKKATEHKILPVNELIEKLASVVQCQMVDLRRALYGTGNYKLTSDYSHFLVDEHIWHSKTKDEKKKIFYKFISSPMPQEPKNGFVLASKAQFKAKLPRVNAGKKPGQRKRPAAERTTTLRHR